MSLAARIAALAQRVAAELHDTGWEDLTSYLRDGYTGLLRGRAKAGTVMIHGSVTLPVLANEVAEITNPIPARFRPATAVETYAAAPLLSTPRITGGGVSLLRDPRELSAYSSNRSQRRRAWCASRSCTSPRSIGGLS